MRKDVFITILDDNQLLLEVNKLADKYNLSCIACAKISAWVRFESGKQIYNNNPGNMRGGNDYYVHPGAVDEYIAGQHIIASGPDDPLRRFRSFETLQDGIECMIQWVKNKHSKAWEYLINDQYTAKEYAMMLGQRNDQGMRYYTADPLVYAAGVSAVYSRFASVI